MKVIGITGGAGAGKSKVLQYIEKEYPAFVCQADEVAKMLQKRGNICYEKIKARYGDGILQKDRELDRKKLAAIVFGDEKERKYVNAMIHPLVKAHIRELIEKEKKKGTPLFILEAALLLEDHYEQVCDEVWYVYADCKERIRRLKESRNYTEEKIETVFAAQLTEEEFKARCDKVIDNSGTFAKTCRQIQALLATAEKTDS